MSRADKRHRLPDDSSSVRVFAFSNMVRGYRPQFSPVEPVVILRSKARSVEQHPCAQWEPLAQLMYKNNPHAGNIFVVDSAAVDEAVTREEDASVIAAGPVAKRISNIMCRLNSRESLLVAAGPTCVLAAKLVFLAEKQTNSRGEALFKHMILVCPPSAEPFQQLFAHLTKHAATRGSKGEGRSVKATVGSIHKISILLNDDKQVKTWRDLLSALPSLVGDFQVLCPCQNLFGILASLLSPEMTDAGTQELDHNVFLQSPSVFRITFALSRFTKQVEQEVESSPLDQPVALTARPSNDNHEDPTGTGTMREVEQGNDDEENDPISENIGSSDPSLLVTSFSGFCPLHPTRRVTVDGVIVKSLGNGVYSVGNAHGCFDTTGLEAAAADRGILSPGSYLAITGQVIRDKDGRSTFAAQSVQSIAPAQQETIPHLLPAVEVPVAVDLSFPRQHAGVCLIRGRKCVLVRDPAGPPDNLRFPTQPVTNRFASLMDCALDAICTQCDITPDNICFITHLVPPIMCYLKTGTVTTLFVAVAVYPPPGGAVRDAFEDELTPSDPYDWFSAAAAKNYLRTHAEKDAVDDIARVVQRAVDARMYVPTGGLGVFGEAVKPNAASGEGGVPEVVLVYSPIDDATISSDSLPPNLQPQSQHFVKHVHITNSAEESDLTEATEISKWLEGRRREALEEGFSSRVLLVLDSSMVLASFFTDHLPMIVGDSGATFVVVVPPSLEIVQGKLRLPALCRSLELADLVVCSSDDVQDDVLSLVAQVVEANIPVVKPDGSLPIRKFSGGGRTLAKYCYQKSLPFVPSKLHVLFEHRSVNEMLRRDSAPSASPSIAWVSGAVWISTRFAFRGDVTVDDCSQLVLTQGDPWWAAVREEDRPPGIDTDAWDSRHGDRQQNLLWIIEGPSQGACDEAWGAIAASLDSMLCDANDWRFWHRQEDPFPPWSS